MDGNGTSHLDMDNALKSSDLRTQIKAIFEISDQDQVMVNKISEYFTKENHVFQYCCLEKQLPLTSLVRALDSTDEICKAIAARFNCNDMEFKYKILSNLQQEDIGDLERSSYIFAIKRLVKLKDNHFLEAVSKVVLTQRMEELYCALECVTNIKHAINVRLEMIKFYNQETSLKRKQIILKSITKLSVNSFQSESHIQYMWELNNHYSTMANRYGARVMVMNHFLHISKKDPLAFNSDDIRNIFFQADSDDPDSLIRTKAIEILLNIVDSRSIDFTDHISTFVEKTLTLATQNQHKFTSAIQLACKILANKLGMGIDAKVTTGTQKSNIKGIEFANILRGRMDKITCSTLWGLVDMFLKCNQVVFSKQALTQICNNQGNVMN